MPLTANVSPPSVSAAPPTSARARPQASRRKANAAADDAAYHGASTAGVKRGAAEKAEGEPRGKRKRADAGNAGGGAAGPSAGAGMRRTAADKPTESDGKHSMVRVVSLVVAMGYVHAVVVRSEHRARYGDLGVPSVISPAVVAFSSHEGQANMARSN